MSLNRDCRIPATSCTGFSLRRATRAVQRLYDRHLAEVGLRGTQFTVLNAAFLQAPSTMNQLADSLAMDRTTLTRNLKPLEAKGWIAVSTGGSDHRTRWVEVTNSGKRVLKKALPRWRQAQEVTEALIGNDELVSLRRQLEKLESVSV